MTVLHILVYLSVLIFLVAVIARMIRIANMPVHLRWELYPVPHEKGRAAYGGSIMEEVDWWTKPREVDRLGTLGAMISEIILLKGVREHNRPLWFGSWTLHFGLYLLVGELGLLILTGILLLAGVAGVLMNLLTGIITVLAGVGSTLGLIGALVMFLRRLSDADLKRFNNFSHYFNLLLLGAIYLTGLIWVLGDAAYGDRLAAFLAGAMSFSALPVFPAVGYWHLGYVLLFLVYFPFTHMTHAFVKYFTYHDIRWEDEPNRPGGKLEQKIGKLVNQKVTWAAPHVNSRGDKTWVDIVSEKPEDKEDGKA